MLLDEDPRRQRLDRVIVEHRHGGLQDDRTVVELGCHQMHGRARDAHAVFERLPLRVESGKRRQQRRMDIQDAVREGLEQRSAHQTHEAGQADQIDGSVRGADRRARVVGVAVGIVARVEVDRQAGRRDDSGAQRIAGCVASRATCAVGRIRQRASKRRPNWERSARPSARRSRFGDDQLAAEDGQARSVWNRRSDRVDGDVKKTPDPFTSTGPRGRRR